MAIYQALRVPEVWRLDGDILSFHVLNAAGEREVTSTSRTFPWLAPGDLVPFLVQARSAPNSNAVIRDFRVWIQRRRRALGI